MMCAYIKEMIPDSVFLLLLSLQMWWMNGEMGVGG